MHTFNVDLPALTNVKATVLTPNSVIVTWDQSSEITGYFISCTSPVSYAGVKNAMVHGGDTTSHILTKLVENTPYEIRVQGLTSDGRKSDPSTEKSIITQKAGRWYIRINIISDYVIFDYTAPSSAPQDIEVSSDDPGSLIVSWQPPLERNCNGSITGYVIQYGMVGSDDNMIVNVPNETTLAIPGLFAHVEYFITMAAVNANGTGPFSKPVVATSGEDGGLNYIVNNIRNYVSTYIPSYICT